MGADRNPRRLVAEMVEADLKRHRANMGGDALTVGGTFSTYVMWAAHMSPAFVSLQNYCLELNIATLPKHAPRLIGVPEIGFN